MEDPMYKLRLTSLAVVQASL